MSANQPIQQRAPLDVHGRRIQIIVKNRDPGVRCLQVALRLRNACHDRQVKLFKEFQQLSVGMGADINPHPNGAALALMRNFGLGLTVRGEPWHVGNAGGSLSGGVMMANILA